MVQVAVPLAVQSWRPKTWSSPSSRHPPPVLSRPAALSRSHRSSSVSTGTRTQTGSPRPSTPCLSNVSSAQSPRAATVCSPHFFFFFALEPFRFSLSLICASAVAGVPAVLGMQSITSVAISFASESAMTTVPGEHSSAKDQSMCHLALQCASLSRAVRLNLIQAGTTAMTFVVQSVHMLVLGVHTFPDSEQEQRKFGAIVIEPMTAITCLPYLDACSSTSTGRQISNKILAFVPCLTTFFALLFDALVFFFFFYQTVREVLCLNS